MDNIKVRCRSCGKEVEGAAGRAVSCGCPNRVTVVGDVVSAVDMDKVVMLNSYTSKKEKEGLTDQDLQWQEQRRRRKVRKLDFEIR
tara:strand:+ start:896 stop:1153 length:258 start_codon:yes stop_codon:yes gene_type:complete